MRNFKIHVVLAVSALVVLAFNPKMVNTAVVCALCVLFYEAGFIAFMVVRFLRRQVHWPRGADPCPFCEGPLPVGTLYDGLVTCPWCLGSFDLHSGDFQDHV